MALLVWQDDLETGIEAVDNQHRRIVEMINHLHVNHKSLDRAAAGEVIDEMIDYTLSHFAFEEELMEESGYPFTAAHKRVHEIFTRRVAEYRLRFQAGEDVTEELKSMLSRWLFNHIRGDDKAYAETIKRHLHITDSGSAPKKGGFFARLKQLFFSS
ncbi:MAG: bacteriohemerythrin [Xanthomonadaceae bacterium]|jgi:hemerythrin|nr:bacteriohemerythrin [Xanthomonadaceae bacterium]